MRNVIEHHDYKYDPGSKRPFSQFFHRINETLIPRIRRDYNVMMASIVAAFGTLKSYLESYSILTDGLAGLQNGHDWVISFSK